MKKNILLTLCISSIMMLNAQNKIEDFATSNNGVMYKIEKANPEGQRLKEGDVVIGRFAVYYGDTLIFDGMRNPAQPLFPVTQQNNMFKGDLIDGLKLMHQGETTMFAFSKDTMAKYPTGISKDLKVDYVFYRVSVDSITTIAELQRQEQEQRNLARLKADSLKDIEASLIADYIKNNDWSRKSVDGIFVKHLQSGKGSKAKDGDKVKINYTGQLLDGTVFDTSIETVAKQHNKYNSARKYEPLEFTIGKRQMIPGFEIAAKQLNKGGKAIVLIPSELAYRDRDLGEIKPYSPLLFTIELVDIVK